MQHKNQKHQSLAQAIFKEDLPALLESQKWILVDIRMPLDFLEGHLRGALNITTQEELFTLLDSSKDKNILLNCYSGHTVSLLGSDLIQQGYTNIYFLDDAINESLEFLRAKE